MFKFADRDVRATSITLIPCQDKLYFAKIAAECTIHYSSSIPWLTFKI